MDDLRDGVPLPALRQLDRLASHGQAPALLHERVAGWSRYEHDIVLLRRRLALQLRLRLRLRLSRRRLRWTLDRRLEPVEASLHGLEQVVEPSPCVVCCGHAAIVADLR